MMRRKKFVGVLLSGLLVVFGPSRPSASAPKDDHPMGPVKEEFGKANPKAPAELSRFAFLIGRWRCKARVELATGETQTLQATWLGRFILDGYAIADEYRMTTAAGELLVLGMNFRTYDAIKQTWNIKWLNAFAGTWLDLGPEELGGVRVDGQSIIYAFKEPMAGHAYTRATYTSVSESHFTWRGEKSDDRKTWSEFMVIECHRSKE
jgi:hypothetical protein